MRVSIFFISLFFSLRLGGQNLELNLNRRAEDGQFKKLILIAPVFGLRNDSVSNPLDISSARATDAVQWIKVKLPETNPKMRTGFTWLYNGAKQSDFAPFHTLVFIENPGWTHYPSRIWIDKNYNFDLTDDGEGDTLTLDQDVKVSLSGPRGYQVQLSHFPSDKFAAVATMNDAAVRKLQGNRVFLGTASSLREQRLNTVAADWSNGLDSFTIGVKDVNCNGVYNEPEDVLMIGKFQAPLDNLQAVNLEKGKAYLEWAGSAYQIKKVYADGSKIELFRDTASRLKYSLNTGDKLPRFRYCVASKPARRKGVRRLKGKTVFIYVWRDGVSDFYRDSAAWHALGRLKDKNFATLGLNYGASATYVYQYNRYFETAILQGFSSNELNEKLKIKNVPYGILVDKKQRIIATGITPEQVLKRFN